MQFLKISSSLTLTELSDLVGDRNVDYILAANRLNRVPNIGQAFQRICDQAIDSYITSDSDDAWKQQMTILNTFTQDSDVFETAALSSPSDWALLRTLGTFPNMLKIPESITLPDSVDILGNGKCVSKVIYSKTMKCLQLYPHTINPAIFNEYSTIKPSKLINPLDNSNLSGNTGDPFQWFKLPWGDITLYSSLDGTNIDFPVYPEEFEDSRSATYGTMPDMIYQYEPWQVYESSGPRAVNFKFDMHRDMWTGDHRDGKCNELIRFCEANCYPEYSGSLVNTSLVTLYIKGKALITGVMTEVSTSWDGPIGLDGYYLHCVLQISITEVSQQALNYSTVKNKSLIG